MFRCCTGSIVLSHCHTILIALARISREVVKSFFWTFSCHGCLLLLHFSEISNESPSKRDFKASDPYKDRKESVANYPLPTLLYLVNISRGMTQALHQWSTSCREWWFDPDCRECVKLWVWRVQWLKWLRLGMWLRHRLVIWRPGFISWLRHTFTGLTLVVLTSIPKLTFSTQL